MTSWVRLFRYYSVGLGGAVLQTASLGACVHLIGLDYRVAMMLALLLTLAHNFAWHARWTWGDRRLSGVGLVVAFVRFVGGNGLVSFMSTVVLMPVLVEQVSLDPVVATVVTIAAGGLVNFWLAAMCFRSTAPGSPAVGFHRRSTVPQCDA